MNRHLKYIIILFVFILTTGCDTSSQAEQKLSRYLKKIEQLAPDERKIHYGFDRTLKRYPSKGSLQLQTSELRIPLSDYLSLRKCDLKELIAERNSILGRVMPVSRQLHWEHRFYVGLTECRQHFSGNDNKLTSLMDSIITIKENDLAQVYWNATFASPEFQKLFSLSVSPLSPEDRDLMNPKVINAINYFARIGRNLGQPEFEFDIKDLEQNYQILHNQKYASALLMSVQLLTYYLYKAAEHINYRLRIDPKPNKYLTDMYFSIFREIYAVDIQPYLSMVHRNGQQLLTVLEQLFKAQHVAVSPVFIDYYQSYISPEEQNSLWQNFEISIKKHNQAWQRILNIRSKNQ